MKKILSFGVFCLFLSLLTACGTTVIKTVVQEKYIVIKTPEDLLKCDAVPLPPDPALYEALGADWAAKEKLLSDYSVDLLGTIQTCKNSFAAIAAYQLKQEANVKEKEAQVNKKD